MDHDPILNLLPSSFFSGLGDTRPYDVSSYPALCIPCRIQDMFRLWDGNWFAQPTNYGCSIHVALSAFLH